MSAAVAEVLRGARALLPTPDKWWSGFVSGGEPNGRVCVAMAIGRSALATQSLATCGIVARDARRALVAAAGLDPGNIASSEWNDAPDRTHAEVLAAFDRAIAAEEAAS